MWSITLYITLFQGTASRAQWKGACSPQKETGWFHFHSELSWLYTWALVQTNTQVFICGFRLLGSNIWWRSLLQGIRVVSSGSGTKVLLIRQLVEALLLHSLRTKTVLLELPLTSNAVYLQIIHASNLYNRLFLSLSVYRGVGPAPTPLYRDRVTEGASRYLL